MRGLKVFLFISFLLGAVYGLLLLFLPSQMAEAKWGPQDIPSAHYGAVTYLAFAGAAWYAFRNPKKNVAVVRALITLMGLSALVALYHGITGAEGWDTALPNLVSSAILGAGLGYFYPRGEKAT